MNAVPKPAVRELTAKNMDAVRGAYAALKTAIPGFKQRRAQLTMIGGASRALATAGGVAAIEAKTGTGKSLGYLCAGVPLALESGKKLVISTGTIQLQEQLFKRDIPAFLKATGLKATVSLAKGRGRFVCPKQLAEVTRNMPDDDLFGVEEGLWAAPPQASDIARVQRLEAEFDAGVWSGDLDAIDPLPSEIQRLVTMPASTCAGRACPYAKSCPMLANRKETLEAEIVVTNHDLLLADLSIMDEDGKGGTLIADPADALYVIDEGHHLGARAIRSAESSVALTGLPKRYTAFKKVMANALRMASVTEVAKQNMQDCVRLADQATQEIGSLTEIIRGDWTPAPGEYEPRWRAEHGILPEAYRAAAANLAAYTRDMLSLLSAAALLVKDSPANDKAKERAGRVASMLADELTAHRQLWSQWAAAPHQDGRAPFAKWIELTDGGALIAKCSPVRAAPILESLLWSRAESVLVTSATLATGTDFTHFSDAVGLPAEAEIMALPSPFNLQAQASFEVPWLGVQPSQFDGHVDAICGWLEGELAWNEGALVLFSSKRKLQAVLERLSPDKRSRVLAQGTLSKAELVKTHADRIASGKGSVIFGTNQMGEGLDLPGLLKTVVITQMPFAVPTEPVLATLAEWVEKNGRNAFAEIVVPEAIRVLTQYCGRLIRREGDAGKIVCLDQRLIEKSYGRRILSALPPFRQVIGKRC